MEDMEMAFLRALLACQYYQIKPKWFVAASGSSDSICSNV